MFISNRKKDILESTESKLTRLFAEMNAEAKTNEPNKLICETECTMARIRSYSDFLYLLKVKPLQTACYYAAVVALLLAIAAFFCSEWLLGAVFVVLLFIFATLPRNMRISYFNKQADLLEQSYHKIINTDFGDEAITITLSTAIHNKTELDENGDATARRSAVVKDDDAVVLTVPYKNISVAYECSHSFYILPFDENRKRMDTIICDKTQFLCGTPMELRDLLARKCGRLFKLKMKKM